jgi:hypothetical protein
VLFIEPGEDNETFNRRKSLHRTNTISFRNIYDQSELEANQKLVSGDQNLVKMSPKSGTESPKIKSLSHKESGYFAGDVNELSLLRKSPVKKTTQKVVTAAAETTGFICMLV